MAMAIDRKLEERKLFILENLTKISDFSKVNFICINGTVTKTILAVLTDGNKIPLTKEVKREEFFKNPMEAIKDCLGWFYTRNFIVLRNCGLIVNPYNIVDVKSSSDPFNKENVCPIFSFENGFNARFLGISKNYYNKIEGKLKEYISKISDWKRQQITDNEAWCDDIALPNIEDEYYK